ncbi:hypothetical protein COBT_004183, partial [Conglomerata obtusa]
EKELINKIQFLNINTLGHVGLSNNLGAPLNQHGFCSMANSTPGEEKKVPVDVCVEGHIPAKKYFIGTIQKENEQGLNNINRTNTGIINNIQRFSGDKNENIRDFLRQFKFLSRQSTDFDEKNLHLLAATYLMKDA